MNRLAVPAILFFSLCPLLMAQQQAQVTLIPDSSRPAMDEPQLSAPAARNEAIKKARTVHINSDTAFLTVSTLERALLKQKNWDKLGLNIVANDGGADLELQIDRLIFTHIHTYTLTDKATSIVLASGRVRAFDGVVASGPMAEQIVKILASAKLPRPAPVGEHGL